MLILFVTLLVVAIGELFLFLVSRHREKKREKDSLRSLYKLMESRVLSRTLQSYVTSEQAARMEGQSLFLRVEFPDTKPWMAYMFPLDESITIGRNHDNKICIRDDQVSRLHCKISYANGYLYLQDLGASNGTVIRRGVFRKISLLPQQTEILQDGDKIMAGNYLMRIHIYLGYEVYCRSVD